jgi:hypothetical protein
MGDPIEDSTAIEDSAKPFEAGTYTTRDAAADDLLTASDEPDPEDDGVQAEPDPEPAGEPEPEDAEVEVDPESE